MKNKRYLNLKSYKAKNQIEIIFEVIGTPSDEEIGSIPREKSRKLVKSMPKKKGKSLESIFPKASPNGILFSIHKYS